MYLRRYPRIYVCTLGSEPKLHLRFSLHLDMSLLSISKLGRSRKRRSEKISLEKAIHLANLQIIIDDQNRILISQKRRRSSTVDSLASPIHSTVSVDTSRGDQTEEELYWREQLNSSNPDSGCQAMRAECTAKNKTLEQVVHNNDDFNALMSQLCRLRDYTKLLERKIEKNRYQDEIFRFYQWITAMDVKKNHTHPMEYDCIVTSADSDSVSSAKDDESESSKKEAIKTRIIFRFEKNQSSSSDTESLGERYEDNQIVAGQCMQVVPKSNFSCLPEYLNYEITAQAEMAPVVLGDILQSLYSDKSE